MQLGTRHLRPNKQSRTDLIDSNFVSVKSDGLLAFLFFSELRGCQAGIFFEEGVKGRF
jgi:hypothetical protein